MIYLDNAATTPLCPEAYEAMIPYLTKYYGNPASRSTPGREASRALEEARESIAEMLGTKPKEIYFTSGATESNNWALKGVALRHRDKGKHIITTQVEHPSVLNSGKWLERMGFDVTYLPVSEKGSVDPADVYRAISSDTTLVSVMATNNETGISNPICQIADIAKDKGVYFHVDATQSITHDIINMKDLKANLLSFSAHKFNGPKGVGILYIREGTKVENYMCGGSQEFEMRAGTHNVAGIVGMAKAMEVALSCRQETNDRIQEMASYLVDRIRYAIQDAILNSDPEHLEHIVHFTFKDVDEKTLIDDLDKAGVVCSSGSACEASCGKPSHVISSIRTGISGANLRVSFGRLNSLSEVQEAADAIIFAVTNRRSEKANKKG